MLLALVVLVASTSAFTTTPSLQGGSQTSSSTSLYGAFDGKKGLANAYARGGKPSWVFEAETMYVEAPETKKKEKKSATVAAAPKKKVVAAVAKKAATVAKKASTVPKKAVNDKTPPKSTSTFKSPFASLFQK